MENTILIKLIIDFIQARYHYKELNHKLHVVPHQDGWVVSEGNFESVGKVFSSQEAALKYAVGIAKAQWLEVVIYGDNGEIKEVINPGIDALLERRSKGGIWLQMT